ncbi:MAG: arginine--tRNA ligase, partial [Deinococcales bacterium]|nr:arginine--tRNA ligase [Chitinophagaceae bacterium]
MSVVTQIKKVTAKAIADLYAIHIDENNILVNATKPEFVGDYTVVLFAFVKQLKQSPDVLGQALGTHLVTSNPTLFTAHNVIKGFLNLSITDAYWRNFTN